MHTSLLISSGEFARMCNVSRELLIHYDKIGLLKPKEVRENGYRYYSLRQLYLFDAIRFFSDTGMTMREIKQYLEHRTTELFLQTAQESIEQMRRQRDILEARIGMMEKMRYITQRALSFPKGKPRVSLWDEAWFVSTDVPNERTQRAYAEAFSTHSDFCRSVIGVTGFPLGRIVDIPDPEHPEDFRYTKLLTWIGKPESTVPWLDRIVRKPKGNYAVILHQGGTSKAAASYKALLDFVRKEKLVMRGPICELDISSYLMSDSSEDYLLHISVHGDD